ncbi:Gfo/Idh/MocA family protein [Paenibacillus sp.]|uniref:Gfo/Idh/MocA family protein n=1 Tax=Paenibacillus TaxID=44249 RepID=UPI0035631852
MKPRIGIVGLGDIAQKVYMPLLSANDNVDIVGLSSRNPATVERIGAQYRIPGRFASVEHLLKEAKPDIVFVHSPTETHEDIVMSCLQAGAHVYVDKPLSYDLQASQRMADYALDHNLLLAVGFNRRFAPLYTEARRWLAPTGGFDAVTVSKHRTKLQNQCARHTLYDDLIHMLDLLLWLGGDAFKVGSYLERTDAEGRLVLGSGTLLFGQGNADSAGSADGAIAHFGMARLAGADLEKLELHGGGRSAEVLNMERAVWMERGEAPREQTFGSWDTILYRRGFAGVVQHVLDSLADPGSCTVRADRVLPAHRLVEALHPGA